jgi:tetratricopeptide (TPR) repeat protein
MNTHNSGNQGHIERPLATNTLGHKVIQEWERQLLERLLSQLGENERWLLTALAVLNEPFWWGIAHDWLSAPHSMDKRIEIPLDLQPLLIQWHNLSLLQFHHTDEAGNFWYRIHPMAREVLLDRLDVDQARAFHKQAAAFFAAPFIAEARRFLLEQNGSSGLPSEVDCEALARHPGGPIYSWTRQVENPRLARWTMERALKWQERLFLAGEYEAADDLVNTTWAILARWGQKDRTRALLERSIDTVYGLRRGVAQANLAALVRMEGQLHAALGIYDQVVSLFTVLGARKQQAAALFEMSNIYQDLGRLKKAFALQRSSLDIRRVTGDEEGQAMCLDQLAKLYCRQKYYPQALEYNQAAEAIFRRLSSQDASAFDIRVASTLQTRAIILGQMHQFPDSLACFEQSLEINRRGGNPSGRAENLVEMGKVLIQMGELERALTLIRESTELRLKPGGTNLGVNLQAMGLYYEKCSEYKTALEQYRQARHLFQHYQPAELPEIRRQILRTNILKFQKALSSRLRRIIGRSTDAR